MERRIVDIPTSLFRVGDFNWDIDWREQGAGTTNAGYQNINVGALPRWIGSPTVSHIGMEAARFRALRLYARGRTGLFRVRMIDPLFNSGYATQIPFDDSSFFDDGTGFEEFAKVTCPSGAAAGDNQIVLELGDYADDVSSGRIMSYNDYPFAVTYAQKTTDTLYTCQIEMPLRTAVPAGGQIDLVASGLFELVNPRDGVMAYGNSRVARSTLEFREYLR